MKKQSQSGFTVVESVVVVVIVAAIAGVGYYVWHGHKVQPATTVTDTSSYHSPPTSVPAAPQVSSTSDLNNAMAALNQTSVSSSNVDSSQLSTEASGF